MNEPPTVPILRSPENTIPNQYLVRLKEDSDMATHLAWLQQQDPTPDGGSPKSKVLYQYKRHKGYAAVLSKPVLEDLAKRDDVQLIAEDCQPTW